MAGLLALVPVVVTTLGADGSRITTREGVEEVGSVKAIQVLDPTGAGDAYRAGFAAAWIRKLPLSVCAQVASTVSVYAVESYGTQKHHFSIDQVKARYKEAYGSDFPF
jgi:adenosine kinase